MAAKVAVIGPTVMTAAGTRALSLGYRQTAARSPMIWSLPQTTWAESPIVRV